MSKKLLLFITVITLLLGDFCLAQEDDKQVANANSKYENYSFSPAIDIYKRILEKGFTTPDLLRKLGNSYYFNAQYNEAANIYKRLANEFPIEMTPEYYFRYAQTLKSIGDYKNSDAAMKLFTVVKKDDNRTNAFRSASDYLKEIKNNSGRYDLEPFEYNSTYSEFAPSFYKEGVIFSSDRDTGNLAKYRHTWNSQDFLDLYRVDVDSISSNSVTKFGDAINTRLHESTSITTKDGNTLYFTRNNFVNGKYKKDEKGVIRLKIFRATLVNGIWAHLEELPFNNDAYSVAHPALSSDEKILYFASDMPGTFGESDIYKISINEDGSFGKPTNLGNVINTEARETFPFVTSDEVLYMSSDGHPGLGGLDVFATSISNGKLDGIVMNVGEPVNSKMDDFTFIFNEDTRRGYFASNRSNGLGADDIYGFLETTSLKLDCIQKITGTVRDKISNKVLVGATVKVIDENNEEVFSAITDSEGKYTLSINCNKGNFIRAMTQGYEPSEEYLERSDAKPKIIDFYLERDRITAGFGDDLAKLLQLSTIYFDFDKYNIRKDSEIEVEKVIAALEKYPSLKLKVNSHTDSRGRDSYNLWLSQKRAESTVNYMISKGIAKERLEGEGFGETKLINTCVNGVDCSAVEHELNRRAEFIIRE